MILSIRSYSAARASHPKELGRRKAGKCDVGREVREPFSATAAFKYSVSSAVRPSFQRIAGRSTHGRLCRVRQGRASAPDADARHLRLSQASVSSRCRRLSRAASPPDSARTSRSAERTGGIPAIRFLKFFPRRPSGGADGRGAQVNTNIQHINPPHVHKAREAKNIYSSSFSTARKASVGIWTVPNCRIFFLPSLFFQ